MTTILARFRNLYGARPLHLLAVLASFVLLGYVVYVMGPATLWNPKVWWQSILGWFLGAVVLHDLILFPIYALADRAHLASARALRQRRDTHSAIRARVPVVNYVRVPFLTTGLLFLLFFPGIIAQGAPTYLRATGQTQTPFLGRWLLLTAGIFALSALAYLAHVVTVRRADTPRSSPAPRGPNRETSTETNV